jgi:hypothetical protein
MNAKNNKTMYKEAEDERQEGPETKTAGEGLALGIARPPPRCAAVPVRQAKHGPKRRHNELWDLVWGFLLK